MSPVVIIAGLLVLAVLIMAMLKWRRSRQHIGIARPDGPVNTLDPTVTPGSIRYKQVIAPGADPNRIDQPAEQVEDALAVRPGAPEPGQTFTPASPPEQTPNPVQDQTPTSPASPNPPQNPTQPPTTPPQTPPPAPVP